MRTTFNNLISKGILAGFALVFCNLSYAGTLNVCAVPQVYSALEQIKDKSRISFDIHYDIADNIYSKIVNKELKCDLVISSDEKLPIRLVRSNNVVAEDFRPFAKAPLLLWSMQTNVLDSQAKVVSEKRIQSLAVANYSLTPVGFATQQVVTLKEFPTRYLNGRINRFRQEYQVLTSVEHGDSQMGFVTKPVIVQQFGKIPGSYWQVPSKYYDAINYYAALTSMARYSRDAQTLYNFITTDPSALKSFYDVGFSPLNK